MEKMRPLPSLCTYTYWIIEFHFHFHRLYAFISDPSLARAPYVRPRHRAMPFWGVKMRALIPTQQLCMMLITLVKRWLNWRVFAASTDAIFRFFRSSFPPTNRQRWVHFSDFSASESRAIKRSGNFLRILNKRARLSERLRDARTAPSASACSSLLISIFS